MNLKCCVRRSYWTATFVLFFSTAKLFAVDVSPKQYLEDVKYLASDALRGRGTGTPELDQAASYIAAQFDKDHLQPLRGTYFQDFTVTINPHLGPDNTLTYTWKNTKRALAAGNDFVPFNFSASARAQGTLVFAGYGITAPEYNYDDYAGIDVHGKIVIVMRHEPQEFDPNSRFDGRVYTEHSQLLSKAINAKMHGAKAIIFVNDTAAHTGNEDALELFKSEVSPANSGVPFMQVRASLMEKWFALAHKDFHDTQLEIDKELEPQSFAFPDDLKIDLRADVVYTTKVVHNVVGYLPGQTNEYVIVGAHYDHLGLGEQFSLAPSMIGTPHPGADDNASGTAGVLELARWFSSQPKQKRGILFMAFAGEEIGLLGSSFYANHPELPIQNAVAMINMDMIGRVRDHKVYVGGVGTGSTFRQLLDTVKAGYHFDLDASERGGYGSSDHTSFTTKQIPVLFFFSGLHGDYHKPSDTWDKIDAPEAAKLLDLIGDLLTRLTDGQDRPQYVRVFDAPTAHGGVPPGTGSTGGGYGPYFGSIPDFTEIPKGVRFADIRDGSPAAKAGLKAGDVLVEFDGKKIDNLYDFTYALRLKRAGDVVDVEVLRNDQPVRAKVTLAARK